MNPEYFKNVAEEIEKSSDEEKNVSEGVSFIRMKKCEYLARFIKNGLNVWSGKKMYHFMDASDRNSFAQEMIELYGMGDNSRVGGKRKISHRKLLDVLDDSGNYSYDELMEMFRDCADVDGLMDFGGRFRKKALEFCLKTLRKDFSPAAVGGISRVETLQRDLNLSDDEVQILLFLWIGGMLELESDFNEDADCEYVCSVATGIPLKNVYRILSPEAALKKLYLVLPKESPRRRFDLLEEVSGDVQRYLCGIGTEISLKGFRQSAPAKVSFEQLQGENFRAQIALSLIQNHKGDRSLNILFYGKEGTGKTELSRAMAEKLGKPLWEVDLNSEEDLNPSAEGLETHLNIKESMLQRRLRSLKLADWQCRRVPGIILVDEADLILNELEKGALNNLLEEIHSPIIWITNSTSFIEDSTLRRFDYSMSFKSLCQRERESVLDSVLKENRAENLFTPKEKRQIAEKFQVAAGPMTFAVQNVKSLLAADSSSSRPQFSAFEMMNLFLEANATLMGTDCKSFRERESRAPDYSLDGLNIGGSVDEILEVAAKFNQVWDSMDEKSPPNALNILLYGPPGTGKTEFARYLSRHLGRDLIIRRASDLLDAFVGETEKKIRAAFREADKNKSILFLDEADSFLQDRSFATQGWMVTKVNEALTQMENFRGIFIAATNFYETLDKASLRRFAFKLKLDYLKPEGIRKIWSAFFPDFACPEAVVRLPMTTPGDFNAVNGRVRFLPKESLTAERLAAELQREVEAKDVHGGRRIGF